MSKTRNNHYVPKWYQKGCLFDPKQGEVRYLDLKPSVIQLPNGSLKEINKLEPKPPSTCFVQKDLYTIFFGPIINDDIERFLFGNVDTAGSLAVRGFVEGGFTNYHKYFQDFFSYIDIQKIRTPKGLDWIRQHYPSLDQAKLMVEMQTIRNLHCTIWTEGVREIVSARNSYVKFIITDHPVTVYNRSYPPNCGECEYPNDPSIALKGTQTVYVLDKDHCLILTNYEYAQDPSKENSTEKRTNARNFRNSMTRVDAFIRTRNLTDAEVTEINFILKNRANKFIGAAAEEYLYPERTVGKDWETVGEVLLPPKNELWHFGGEIYVGYKDGSSHFQDTFGRTQPENKYLRKVKANPKPQDPCGCGSSKVFQECCQRKPEASRPSWYQLSIRERNIIFANGIQDILGLNKGKTWLDIRKELSDEQVKRIYELFGSLWPLDTDVLSLLPKPDGELRAIYTGIIDPQLTSYLIPSILPYLGEIIIQSPFINPWTVKDEYSPIKFPHQFKLHTLKHVHLFLSLMPFINNGQINFIPDICSFDSHLREQMHTLAEERIGDATPDSKDMLKMQKLKEQEFKRTLWSSSNNVLKRQFKEALPDLTSEQIEATIKHIRSLQEVDPLALLQNNVLDKGGQFLPVHLAPNFEISLFLAQATGAVLITDSEFRWNEMNKVQSLTGKMPYSDYHELLRVLENENFLFCMDFPKSVKISASSQFNNIRKFFSNIILLSQTQDFTKQSILALKKDFNEAKAKADELLADKGSIATKIKFLLPNGGLVHNNVQRLLLMCGVDKYTKNVPLAAYIDIDLI